ncbi:MAG TPA: protein kinase [Ktedonobacteraceae bacterium]|nr:protein kinase [Ktedonobacteraceae bacterium]
MSMDFSGRTLGQYRIEAPLGAGGMGQVFRGVHQYLDRPAAIKVMQAYLALNPDFRSRFLREAKASAALHHLNIVEIYEFGEQDGVLYLVMELMEEGSLRALLRRGSGQPLPLPIAVDLMRQAAEGLAAADALGMVHRDIKPDNMLLSSLNSGVRGSNPYILKISDFGLAKLAEGGGQTTTGVPMGTLAYMSPEQCQSLKLDGRSDLYSLGIVIYETLTGYQPFQIDNFNDALYKHSSVPPRAPREIRPDLPVALDAIVLRCLAKKPEDRYQNGTELAVALLGVLANLGTRYAVQPQKPVVLAQATPVPGTVLQAPGTGDEKAPVVATLPGGSSVPRVRVLDQSGQTLQVADVKSQGLIIGRQSGNDIVLAGQGVSRQHLQVSWDGRQVSVKDLGSSNGTVLDGVRLIPQVSQVWMERQVIHVGPYWLRLEGPAPDATLVQPQPVVLAQAANYNIPRTAHSLPTEGGVPSVASPNRIGLSANPKTLTITPGQTLPVQVTLTNLGNTVDWFTTTVEGVPPDWVQGAGRQVQLNPGAQETLDMRVSVARTPANRAQDYPVTIRARSREKPNESNTTQETWTVLPFKEDAVRIEPRRVVGRGRAKYSIVLQNSGNAPASYALAGEDDEQKMDYAFDSNPVPVEPGYEARIPLKVRVSRKWIGREDRRPFQVRALPTGSSLPLSAPGEFVNKALIPGWILPALGLLLVAAIALAALFQFHMMPGMTATTTTPIIPGVTVTPNAQATAQAQATATALTAAGAQAQATATAQAQATATAAANAAANPYGGTLALDDKFNNSGNPNGWTCGANATLTYQNDGLHVVNNSTTDAAICIPQNANLVVSNFAAQLQMNVVSGSAGGIAFYINNGATPPTYYSLAVSSDNATYTLAMMNGTASTLVSGRSNNQINNFAIVSGGNSANGCNGNLKVFINQQCLNSTNNTTFTGGMVGLYIPPSSEVVFHHIKVWTGL